MQFFKRDSGIKLDALKIRFSQGLFELRIFNARKIFQAKRPVDSSY